MDDWALFFGTMGVLMSLMFVILLGVVMSANSMLNSMLREIRNELIEVNAKLQEMKIRG